MRTMPSIINMQKFAKISFAIILSLWVSMGWAEADSRLVIKDPSGQAVLRIDDDGNLYLKGKLTQTAGTLNTSTQIDEWCIKDDQSAVQSLLQIYDINTQTTVGDLYIRSAVVSTTQTQTVTGVYRLRDSSGQVIAVVDADGRLLTKGKVFDQIDDPLSYDPAVGRVQFGFSRFETEEGVGQAAILVARSGGSSNACSVAYRTEDQTATAGSDYAAASGTVSFLDGQTTASFTVSIVSDTVTETSESLCLILENPQNGLTLGQVVNVPLIIRDLPPSPADVAPEQNLTRPSNVYLDTQYYYFSEDYAPLIQTGVTSSTIRYNEAACVFGMLYTEDEGTTVPVSGVTVSVLGHPEFGKTLSRQDGRYDMVVNGGGALTFVYEKAGFLRVQREVNPILTEAYTGVESVCMVRPNDYYAFIDLTNDTLQAVHTVMDKVQDDDPARGVTLIIYPNTDAQMIFPRDNDTWNTVTLAPLYTGNDATTPTFLSQFNLYATEFTVGDNGPQAMPAQLDPSVAYTYCLEYSVLEAEAAGAVMVYLDKPAYAYVDNFLGFPAGTVVPNGSYFRDNVQLPDGQIIKAGQWVPEQNGRVIKINQIVQDATPYAEIIVSSDETVATTETLAEIGILHDELVAMAAQYQAGDSFWRVPVQHFTFPHDLNFPYNTTLYTTFPMVPAPYMPMESYDLMIEWFNNLVNKFGQIDSLSQTFTEAVSLPGTGYTLNYKSSRTDGYTVGRSIHVPIYEGAPNEELEEVLVRIIVGGRTIIKRFSQSELTDDLSYTYEWDGLDSRGREMKGYQKAEVGVGYAFPRYYGSPSIIQSVRTEMQSSFGLTSDMVSNYGLIRTGTVSLWRPFTVQIPPAHRSPVDWYSESQAVAGWTVDVHHAYDRATQTVYLGNGEHYEARPSCFNNYELFHDRTQYHSSYSGMDCDEDGNLYYCQRGTTSTFYYYNRFNNKMYSSNLLVRMKKARKARDHYALIPTFLNRTVVSLNSDTDADDLPPVPESIEILTGEGLQLYAGGDCGDTSDGSGSNRQGPMLTRMPANQVSLYAIKDVACGPDGNVYVATRDFVYRINKEGIIYHVAGLKPTIGDYNFTVDADINDYHSSSTSSGNMKGMDGKEATKIFFDQGIYKITVGPDKSVYILWEDSDNTTTKSAGESVFRVMPSGKIYLYVNSLNTHTEKALVQEENEPLLAADTVVSSLYDLQAMPDGSLVLAGTNCLYKVTPEGLIQMIAYKLVDGNSSALASPTYLSNNDGLATEMPLYLANSYLTRGPSGTIYFTRKLYTTVDSSVVSYISLSSLSTDGYIRHIAGTPGDSFPIESIPAQRAHLYSNPDGLAVDDKENIYYCGHISSNMLNNFIARISPMESDMGLGDVLVPSPDGGEIYHFDPFGRHLHTLSAATGQTLLTFAYNDDGQLTGITDAFSHTTQIKRTTAQVGDVPEGTPYEIEAPFGQTTTLEVNANGYLGRVIKTGDRVTSFTYGAGNLLTSVTGPRGDTYSVTYNSQGLLETATDPLGGGATLVRAGFSAGNDVDGHQVTTTSAEGVERTIAHAEDKSGNTTRVMTHPDGTADTLERKTDGTQTYTLADGTTVDTEYTPDPRLGAVVPYASKVTVSAAGLTSVVTTDLDVAYAGDSEDEDFDPFQYTLTSTVDDNGRVSVSTLAPSTQEDQWELTGTSPMGREATTILDSYGRPLVTQAPSVPAVNYSYDAHGRLQEITQGTGASQRKSTYTYNDRGLLQSITDGEGGVTVYDYNDLDRLTTMTLPGDLVSTYAYDDSGNLTSFSPPGRETYRYDYNLRNEATSSTTPLAMGGAQIHTRVDYDLDRRPTTTTLTGGLTSVNDYDSAGRLWRTRASDGRWVQRGFDASTGHLTLEGDGATTYTYTYQNSLPTQTAVTGTVAATMSAAYTSDMRLQSSTLNVAGESFTLGFDYNDDDQPTTIGLMGMNYDDITGRLSDMHLSADGHTFERLHLGYALYGELNDAQWWWNRGQATQKMVQAWGNFAFDRLGRVTQYTDYFNGGQVDYVYTYDTAGRLTHVFDGASTTTYTYDDAGNRLTRARTGQPTEVGVYNALDQLVSYDGRTYTYDDAGRLTSVTGGGQTTTYTWDVWGQLRRVDLPGGDVIEYAIDGAGRRVGRKKNGAWTARWVYGAGLGPVAEISADGYVAKRFVYGSHANVPDYVVTLTRTSTTTLESVAAVVHDRRGGVRELIAMTDSLSSVHTTYDEFGRISDPNPVNVGVAVPFGFAGGMFDPETGLVHLGAREYDPQTGRWLTPDPIGFAGGPNLYGYVLADPVNYIDPLGHWSAAVEGFVSGFGQGAWDGALGFAEGVVPGLNLSAHMFDSSNPGLEVSRLSGSITRDIEITLAFRGRGFNSNSPGSWAWKNVSKRLRRRGFAEAEQHIHHWLIPRNSWGKCIPDFIKNRTWNLMPMPSQAFHVSIHAGNSTSMSLLGRLWFGSPTWAKIAGLGIIDIGGQIGAIAYENLKSD